MYNFFRLWTVVLATATLVFAGGCPAGSNRRSPDTASPPVAETGQKGDGSMAIELTSDDFQAGKPIPKQFTGEGEDKSPRLAWKNVPEGTKQLALICDDPDAPTDQPWVHWVIYAIEPSVTSLPADLPKKAKIDQPIRALQGKNSWPSGQTIGYRGPMPPPGHGVHHYHFKLYALDTALQLEPGLDKKQLLKAMEGHILATGELIGTYQR